MKIILLLKYLFVINLFLYFNFKSYCQTNLPDISGTWEGKNAYPGTNEYVQMFLTQIAPGEYSGIRYISRRNDGDLTPFKDPNLKNVNKVFLAKFNGKELDFEELDTFMTPQKTSFAIISGKILFFNSNGVFEMKNENFINNNGMGLYLKRIDLSIPKEYSNYQINFSSIQIKNIKYTDIRDAGLGVQTDPVDVGKISLTFYNNTPIRFKNIHIEFIPLTKISDGTIYNNKHIYSRQLNISLDKNSIQNIDESIDLGFPFNSDSTRFLIIATCGQVQISKAYISFPSNYFYERTTSISIAKQLIGYWKIKTAEPAFSKSILSSNDYLEFFENGIGISRNDQSNSLNNVIFFQWNIVDSSTLGIYPKNKPKEEIILNLKSDLLTLKRNEPNISSKNHFSICLEKISSNPLSHYRDFIPDGVPPGLWAMAAKYDGKTFTDNHGSLKEYYDIHPTYNRFGEIIKITSSTPQSTNYKNLQFYKYRCILNVSKFAKILETYDNNDNFYVMNCLNCDEADTNNDFYFGSGFIIRYEPKEKIFDFWAKVGPAIYKNPSDLYEKYNSVNGKDILPPFGSHLMNCIQCLGSGKEHDYDEKVWDQNIHNYITKEITKTCSFCHGKGRYYVDDKTGEIKQN